MAILGLIVACCITWNLLSFGEDNQEIMLSNISHKPISVLVMVAYSIQLLVTYALLLYPAIQLSEKMIESQPYSQI